MWEVPGEDADGEDSINDPLPMDDDVEEDEVMQVEERRLIPIPTSTSTQMEPLLPTLDYKEVVHNLLEELFHSNPQEQEAKLRQHLSWAVPFCYKPRVGLDPLDKNQFHVGRGDAGLYRANSLIFPLLEEFLDKDNELRAYFKRTADSSTPPSVCGKLFKSGEPTYSCRDCGLDATCVLCSSCFQQSAHKNHRYRISSSNGGGFCDCGDEEAWKAHPFCSFHKPKHHNQDASSSTSPDFHPNPLPPSLESRHSFLLRLLLSYSFNMLTCKMSLALPTEIPPYSEAPILSSLPSSVKSFLEKETYCTVLYNDETHTYDAVIAALQHALGCSTRDATAFATIVDREGRSIVSISGLQECTNAKKQIEMMTSRHGSFPLKTLVLHSHLVAHQTFAIHVLEWIKRILEKSYVFRFLFANIAENLLTDKILKLNFFNSVMCLDTRLWKAGRLACHHLLISGMLKEYELKKKLAKIFANNYPIMISNFVADDHEHSFSVTSLSVQLFTVPSIATILIEDCDIISTLLGSFKLEWQQKLNSNGKLDLERGSNLTLLKCGSCVLLDLYYLLGFPPEKSKWGEKFRENFNRGLDSIMNLLRVMQGMGTNVRQSGIHVEQEVDWWPFFQLHLKLQPVITSLFKWMEVDKNILFGGIISSLKELGNDYSLMNEGLKKTRKEFGGFAATCVDFDVVSDPVSFHLPLSRFVTGLILLMQQHKIKKGSFPLSILDLDDNVSQMILEPGLRALVLEAQVNVGMWRRNGFAIQNQAHCYHDVRFRKEMKDKDVVALQLAACLMEPNEFCIHILNKFQLFSWVEAEGRGNQDEERNSEGDLMMGEFLSVILNIFSSRFVPGVGEIGETEVVQKELVQLLCIEGMTHSELSKKMGEGGGNGEEKIKVEDVVGEVAVLKKGGGGGSGGGAPVYELKPEFYKDFDWHHYHYSKEERSKAEGSQRERLRKEKGNDIDVFLPPPKLPPFCIGFDKVVNVLKADVLLKVLGLILDRSLKGKVGNRNEDHVAKVLHLVGHGMNEEKEKRNGFIEAGEKWGLFGMIEKLAEKSNFVQHQGMINWIKKKKTEIQPQLLGPERNEIGGGGAQKNVENQVEGVKLSSKVIIGTVLMTSEEEERKRKGAEMKAKALAKIAEAQRKFMSVNAQLFEASSSPPQIACSSSCSPPETEMEVIESESPSKSVALGPHKTPPQKDEEKFTCILCRDENPLPINVPFTSAKNNSSKNFLLSAFVQRSTLLCENRGMLHEKELNYSDSVSLPSCDLWMNRNIGMCPHVSSCGHIMHESCWTSHIEGIKSRDRRRPFQHPASVDIEKGEWLCPMCDGICNAALPMTPQLHKIFPPNLQKKSNKGFLRNDKSFGAYLTSMERRIEEAALENEEEEEDTEDDGSDEEMDVFQQFHSHPIENYDQPLVPQRQTRWARGRGIVSRIFSRVTGRGAPIVVLPLQVGPQPQLPQRGRQMLQDLGLVEGEIPSVDFIAREPTPVRRGRYGSPLPVKFMRQVYAVSKDESNEFHSGSSELHRSLWHSLSYSIMSAEAFHREQNISFFGDNVPIRSSRGLLYLTRFCSLSCVGFGDEEAPMPTWLMEFECIQYFKMIWCSDSSLQSVLEVDAFGLLVFLTYLIPYASKKEPEAPIGGVVDHHNLRVAFTLHLYQLVMKIGEEGMEEGLLLDEEGEEGRGDLEVGKLLYTIWTMPRQSPWKVSGIFERKRFDCDRLWAKVGEKAIPFLRCCAKFYESMTGIPPPPEVEGGLKPFDELIGYLGLPTSFHELFDCEPVRMMVLRWSKHISTQEIVTGNPETKESIAAVLIRGEYRDGMKIVRCLSLPRKLYPLVDLPEDFTELINSVSNFKCLKATPHESRMPTMCLVCGEILCSESYCCQKELKKERVGACNYHAYFCGGGVGIFLRIRECRMFMLYGRKRGCDVVPPYVDEYGETDQGFRRGNPMKLSKERYEIVRKIWAQHGIPEEVSRTTEQLSGTFAGRITNWLYL
ncbi:unnamed protein product [Orchesella dallaii]|uniref:E3 ubiquitin-protein ligase n=1 Tax=Orchesella dallaii TaxID=48710 RepID=A0ABP1PHG3_9HEXA